MAEAVESASHDQLTRMLGGDWSGQTLLRLAVQVLFVISGRGTLILDDTLIDKRYGRLFWEAAWSWSSKERKVMFGVPLVLLIWTDGKYRIPLGYRVWKKGGPSKVELGLELMSYARNALGLRRQLFLFDSWYCSRRVMKRAHDYGWTFISQLRKNRKFDGTQLAKQRRWPRWTHIGVVSGGQKLLVVKHRRKYFCTNRLTMGRSRLFELYRGRQAIEEVFRALKCELGAEDCQSGYHRSEKACSTEPQEGPQTHHIALCLVAFVLIEKDSVDSNISWYQLRRKLMLRRFELPLPAFDALRAAA